MAPNLRINLATPILGEDGPGEVKRKLKLKVQQIRRQAIVFSSSSRTGYCQKCERYVEFLSHIEAAQVLELAEEELVGLVRCGSLHSIEIEGGRHIVCRDSLFSKG
jgi:hypothetical protein